MIGLPQRAIVSGVTRFTNTRARIPSPPGCLRACPDSAPPVPSAAADPGSGGGDLGLTWLTTSRAWAVGGNEPGGLGEKESGSGVRALFNFTREQRKGAWDTKCGAGIFCPGRGGGSGPVHKIMNNFT